MDNEKSQHTAKFYPLPCLLTLAGLFSGFYSIVAAINGNFYVAAIAILVAGGFDCIDGRVARMTHSTSDFGKELDSLCDLVSFGAAPALLAYLWALQPFGRYGWLAAFLYMATTALRLARFNTQTSESGHNFTGLPCPMAAAMVSTTVMFAHFLGATEDVKHISILLLVYSLSYLMVSTHPYHSFKQTRVTKGRRFQVVVAMMLLMILLATEPPITLFVATLLYVLHGPAIALYKALQHKNKEKLPHPKESKKIQ